MRSSVRGRVNDGREEHLSSQNITGKEMSDPEDEAAGSGHISLPRTGPHRGWLPYIAKEAPAFSHMASLPETAWAESGTAELSDPIRFSP